MLRIFWWVITLEVLAFLYLNGVQYIFKCVLEYYNKGKQKKIKIVEQEVDRIKRNIIKAKNKFKCLEPDISITINANMPRRQANTILFETRKKLPETQEVQEISEEHYRAINLLIDIDILFYQRDEYQNEIIRITNQTPKLVVFLQQRTSKKIINPKQP